MSDNKILVSSKIVEISEHKNYLELVNRVCFYDEQNFNGTMLPYDDTAEEKAQTLKNMPVVAKYTTDVMGKPTFKGHEVSIDRDGDVVFGTTPIGVHTDVWIAEDQVEVTDGTTKTLPCLFAKQRIWSRNKNAVAAIQRLYSENNLHNSWEISVSQYVFEKGIKKLTDYAFEGNAFIGVAPAYGNAAQVLSVASRECELLVAEALSQDLLENDSTGNEVHEMDGIINETVEPVEEVIAEVVEETPAIEEVVEVEETTEVVAEEPQETVQADPAVSELDEAKARIEILMAKIDEKNSALVEANKQINELSAQVEALAPYKEAAEKAELEAAEAKRVADIAELRQYAESAGVLSKEELESEEVATLINDLKALEIKALIADRIVEKSKNAKPIETSQKRTAKVRTEINYSEDTTNPVDALRNFIRRG